MKAFETGSTLAAAFIAATFVLVLAALVAGGVLAAAGPGLGFDCW
jgi:hypothetical protein